LLGTERRALCQRKQGRDLFDLATALKDPNADAGRIVAAFLKYMEHEGHKITRAQFEENVALKLSDPNSRGRSARCLRRNTTGNRKRRPLSCHHAD
jgi:hypothetical protein